MNFELVPGAPDERRILLKPPRTRRGPNRGFLAALMLLSWLLGLPLFGALTPARADLIHNYAFNNSLADDFGGPALVANGGTLGAGNYSFMPNQGLSLTGGLTNTSVYSILTDFSFAKLDGYNKVIDFQNRAADQGVYVLDSRLNFFNFATSDAPDFAANTPARLVVTRDATGQVNGYVNGVQRISFADTSGAGISASNILNFFTDDNVQGNESSAGSVTKLSIYDNALSGANVAALGGPGVVATPEPQTWAMMFLGMGAMALVVRRKREVEA